MEINFVLFCCFFYDFRFRSNFPHAKRSLQMSDLEEQFLEKPKAEVEESADGLGQSSSSTLYKEADQDRLLPVANIVRIMKKVIPSNEKISKGAKDTLQECVSEFIGFITSEAADLIKAAKRKTINGEDVIAALENVGFGEYKECLIAYANALRTENMKKGGSSEDLTAENELVKGKGRGRKRKQPISLPASTEQSISAQPPYPQEQHQILTHQQVNFQSNQQVNDLPPFPPFNQGFQFHYQQ